MSMTRRDSLRLAMVFAASMAVHGQIFPATAANQVTKLSDSELKSDAAIAWRYFANSTSRASKGLVPAAIWPQDGGYGEYGILTMWDVGSIILAYVSARSIGLIDAKEFDERITNVLAFIKRSEYRWGKQTLPNYRTNIGNGKPAEAGYDSTDTGRLLVALHVLEKVTNGVYNVRKLIDHWDLPATIEDGQIYDIKSGKKIKSESNNYIYYIARAHRLWDIKVATGDDTKLAPDNAGSKRVFMAKVAATGAIATEPHVNEAIELGHSNESRLLAATLYAAQQDRYAKTGHLTAVSEAPISAKPWFTYQGYKPFMEGWSKWPVDSAVTEKRWATEAFADKHRMVNTKAAYMWLATHSDDYTKKLRQHVRAAAVSNDRGFMPGVYEASGKPPGILDVNTNATVLQSVAFLLAGRQPLVNLNLQPK